MHAFSHTYQGFVWLRNAYLRVHRWYPPITLFTGIFVGMLLSRITSAEAAHHSVIVEFLASILVAVVLWHIVLPIGVIVFVIVRLGLRHLIHGLRDELAARKIGAEIHPVATSPSKIGLFILGLCARPQDREALRGDAVERYGVDVLRYGNFGASLIFWCDVTLTALLFFGKIFRLLGGLLSVIQKIVH